MNFFPLCTAMVCPTISGTTVERRDQVLMTFLSPPRFMTSTFSSRGTSTKGPFFNDLDICLLFSVLAGPHPRSLSLGGAAPRRFPPATRSGRRRLLLSPLYDEPVRRLPVPRLVTLGRHAPRRHGVPAARGLAFAAAERVIHRVHRDAAHVRALAEPAAAARLPDRHVLVVDVADLPDRRDALDADLADLAGGHLDRGVLPLL